LFNKNNGSMFRVSCVLCIYYDTNPFHLDEAVASIIMQTYQPIELIIVVDGNIPEKLLDYLNLLNNKMKSNNINFITIRLEFNLGPGAARNKGVTEATGDLIAIMDSDDISRPERFELQVIEFEKNCELSCCGGIIAEFEFDKFKIQSYRIPKFKHQDIIEQAKLKSPINNVTAMIKKSDFIKVGGYPIKRTSEDYQLWATMIGKKMKFTNLNHIIVDVRFNSTNLNNRKGFIIFRDDLMTQKCLYENNITNRKGFYINVFLYFCFRFIPSSIKKTILGAFFREKK